MPLDKTKYDALIDGICKIFVTVFGTNIILVEKQVAIEHMGFFKLVYKYFPLEYDLVLESDRDVFSIQIYDKEGANNNLYRIEKYNSITTIENVKYAIQMLQSILEKNNFCLYITRDDKLYRKRNNQYERVKDWKELLGNKD